MQREIKFRAWDKFRRKMCSHEDIKIWDRFMEDDMSNQYAPLMQYTGLKDKNGKEIYEGDILEFYDIHGVVKFGLHSDLVYNGWYVETMNGQCELNESFQFAEVIGNIHGNQELLEKVFNRR